MFAPPPLCYNFSPSQRGAKNVQGGIARFARSLKYPPPWQKPIYSPPLNLGDQKIVI